MEKEKWVQINKIQGFEEIKDCYWISNSDEDVVVNRNTRKQLKPSFNTVGYLTVGLMTNQNKVKTCKVHTLKAHAFLYVPNPLTYNIVRHLNDCKTDNRLENLAWGTMSDNIKDSIRNGSFSYESRVKNGAKNGAKNGKKTSKPIRCIETEITYLNAHEAEYKTGINRRGINYCCHGKRQRAGGFHWEFVNKEENENE